MNVRCSVNPGLVFTGPFLSPLRLRAKKRRSCLKAIFLCGSSSLRDILFLFTQRRREAKPQRGIFFAACPVGRGGRGDNLFFVHAKAQRVLIFATPLLCEIYFFSLREKIKMLENKPSLLAHAFTSLVPCSLKNEPNFRSP